MTGPTHEHWFDRLAAAPRTRRQVLQAALAGAVLTLPFARTAHARIADDPHACQKGCLYTSHAQLDRRLDACISNLGQAWTLAGYLAAGGFMAMGTGVFSGGLSGYVCSEVALLRHKSTQYDCLQSNCPGFDPRGKDGPCAHCPPNARCCYNPKDATGYGCCDSECCTKEPVGCTFKDPCTS
jgi:hypothetical protein